MNKEGVLFIDLGSHYGGVETYVEGLAGILGPHIRGYAVCSLPKLAEKLRAQAMTVVCVPILGSKWFKALRFLVALLVVPYMLVRFGIRTVQLNGYFESLLLGPLRLFGCKTIYTMHGPRKRNSTAGTGIRSASFLGPSPDIHCASPHAWSAFLKQWVA